MQALTDRCLVPALAAALMWFAAAEDARTEIILSATNGSRVIGESIKFENEQVLEIEVYRGFTCKVPKSAIARREDVDRSQKQEREEFGKRLQGLRDRDIAGRLELARWAREKGLTVQSLGLLTDLKGRFPRDARVRAAFPAPAFRKTLSEDEKTFLRKQVEAFFAEGGKPEDVLAALEGRDALPPGMSEEWARVCLDEARKGIRVKEGDSKFKNGEFESDLHIELRRSTSAKPPAPAGRESGAADRPATTDSPWPVVVSLHGGGLNDGHWSSGGPMYAKLFSRHFDKLILVAPTVMSKSYAEWGGNPNEELQVKAILRAVKRTWNVDTDRIYLAGYSMGGYGTWHIGGHEADQFAGLVSGAGGILIGAARGEAWGWGVVGNLMHTPIAFQHGGKDKPAPPWSDRECNRILTELAALHPGCYRHLYKFFPENGHGLPESGSAEAVAWVAPFRREPYPKKICWEPRRAFNRQFYWLRVERPRIFTRLEAEISGNRVSVRTLNINGGFSVLLNRQLVDLDKPVTVEVDGTRVFEGQVPETLSTILTTVADRIDERQWFSARIDI